MLSTSKFNSSKNQKSNLLINIGSNFSKENLKKYRQTIMNCIDLDSNKVYINAQEVEYIDLGAINEVINSHYHMEKFSKKLVLVYKKGSIVESWVNTTGINRFIRTAVVPTNDNIKKDV